MTTEPDLDPRVAALASLAQELMTQYGQLAQSVAEHLPDSVKAELVEHVQGVLGEAQGRYAEIAAEGFGSQPSTYVLSTRRPGVVSGRS